MELRKTSTANFRLTLARDFHFLRVPFHRVRTLSTIASILLVVSISVRAQDAGSTAAQSLTLEVKPVARLVVNGDPGLLLINDAVPGSSLTTVSDYSTRYDLVTNVDQMKIVASIDDPMPSGTRLLVRLSTAKAVSTGDVDLSGAVSPVDVVTAIGRGSERDQQITYTFAADAEVGQIPTQSRTVTLTLTN